MQIKIFDLNLWNYNNFEERKPRIIDAIEKHDPDIIAFQEVRDDLRFNSKGYNQARQLNSKLGYKYFAFMKTMDVNKVNSRFQNPDCIEGLALLSKYPIAHVIRKRLKQHKEDKYTRGVLYARIKKEEEIDVCIIHFSPGGFFGKLHLEETLDYFAEKKLTPIILGDLNIDDLDFIISVASKDYYVGNEFNHCITLPETKRTIDDILIPRKYKFETFFCTGDDLSDHKALIAEVSKRTL